MRTAAYVIVSRITGNPQSVVDGCGQVFGFLRIAGREFSDLVRCPNDIASPNTTSGKKNRLKGAPMITAWAFVMLFEQGDFRGSTEFTGHNNKGLVEQPTGL